MANAQSKKDILDCTVAGVLIVTIDSLNRAIEMTEYGNSKGVVGQVQVHTLKRALAEVLAVAAIIK